MPNLKGGAFAVGLKGTIFECHEAYNDPPANYNRFYAFNVLMGDGNDKTEDKFISVGVPANQVALVADGFNSTQLRKGTIHDRHNSQSLSFFLNDLSHGLALHEHIVHPLTHNSRLFLQRGQGSFA